MTSRAVIDMPLKATAASPSPAAWLPVAAGVLLLYVPTYHDIAAVFWSTERGAPGVAVLAIWLWLLWRERAALRNEARTASGSVLGWLAIGVGGGLYALGRSQQMFQLEAGSALAILPGISLVLLGPKSTRRLWFVWAFLIFTVPLPGSLVDAVVVPLKEMVAATVTEVLFRLGLPIARDGVVIYVGQYQLFIADACSGLNQLVALAAIGVLYVHLMRSRSRVPTVLLLAAVLPVAVAANLARVGTLVLATYYGGDGFGRELHDYVSYAEIGLAFGAFFLLDRIVRASHSTRGRPA